MNKLQEVTPVGCNKTIEDGRWIVLKEEVYHKATKKAFSKKIDKIEREVYSAKNYNLYIDSVPAFNNPHLGEKCRATKNYTVAGYIPYKVVTSFEGYEKHVATFIFLEIYYLLKNAGSRERYILENAISWERMKTDRIHECYTFITEEGNRATYDAKSNNWVG